MLRMQYQEGRYSQFWFLQENYNFRCRYWSATATSVVNHLLKGDEIFNFESDAEYILPTNGQDIMLCVVTSLDYNVILLVLKLQS